MQYANTNQTGATPEEMQIEKFKKEFVKRMEISCATYLPKSTTREKYMALAYAVRDNLMANWIKTRNVYYDSNDKRVHYLSMEFLMGRALGNYIVNLSIEDTVKKAMEDLGFSLENLEDVEWDAGLGNGGLGRLAACFLDSMATMNLPAYGYGIRYEFGMFEQKIVNNKQMEYPDTWLRHGYPFEIQRSEETYFVNFGGRVVTIQDTSDEEDGPRTRHNWIDTEQVLAVPYDIPIPGYATDNVNTLRLWSSRATREFNLKTFDDGDYMGAVDDKNLSETISKVLYPNDNKFIGKQLRFKQQYFMISATIQDILTKFKKRGNPINALPSKVVIQLNDTHPTLAIPELMRILLDIEKLPWDRAWELTTRTFAFTNHTVLPEALEKWNVKMFEEMLPRHMQIVYEINRRFLDEVAARFPGDFARRERMSIIEEGDEKRVRMANLAVVCCFSVNGVAELHTRLIKESIFSDFYEMFPEKFNNKTNGITPRRWLRKANPQLSGLISKSISSKWVKNLDLLRELEKFSKDKAFLDRWMNIKRENKANLGKLIEEKCGVRVHCDALFDVQVKRIHEYKRQLLNVLHCIHYYFQIKDNKNIDFVPRTAIFAGKAAPGYYMAKLIIQLINCVGSVINKDTTIKDKLKIVFLPNYGVTLAEKIIPAADLSEQISTAGLEASGTGNMKFALNGALTIGTLDGANIEIMEEVGSENIFIFGYKDCEIRKMREQGYNPWDVYNSNPNLQRVLNSIRDGFFSANDPGLFKPVFDTLLTWGDHYFHLADFASYIETQEKVSLLYGNKYEWHEKGVLNSARMGKFSSDRVVAEYSRDIWGVKPRPVSIV
ncbi:MAG: glycogen/starch/alpha-glucan phosphorylase [Oligoflexales bacterium]|nr:glycogen/starch/alpha-glucan phosphorylase [Oligoflexales bacterium]